MLTRDLLQGGTRLGRRRHERADSDISTQDVLLGELEARKVARQEFDQVVHIFAGDLGSIGILVRGSVSRSDDHDAFSEVIAWNHERNASISRMGHDHRSRNREPLEVKNQVHALAGLEPWLPVLAKA